MEKQPEIYSSFSCLHISFPESAPRCTGATVILWKYYKPMCPICLLSAVSSVRAGKTQRPTILLPDQFESLASHLMLLTSVRVVLSPLKNASPSSLCGLGWPGLAKSTEGTPENITPVWPIRPHTPAAARYSCSRTWGKWQTWMTRVKYAQSAISKPTLRSVGKNMSLFHQGQTEDDIPSPLLQL